MKRMIFLLLFMTLTFHLYGIELKKIAQIPLVPKEGNNVKVIAEIHAQEGIEILKLFYSINGSVFRTTVSDSNVNDFYYFHIPEPLRTDNCVDYYIYAENVSSDIVVSDTYRFVVGQVSILFDYTREETAGNADWVIDNNMPYPSPSNPTSETSWLGAISSWAFELYQAGYNVVTLPPDSAITYGTTHPLDLSNFDVYVICEPQNPFSYQEEKAIYDFARNGGGLFLVSDHYGADRNGNGWDATEIFNAMGIDDSVGIHFNSENESNNNITEDSYNYDNGNGSDTIFHGPFGDITEALCYHNGTTMRIWGNAIGKVWKSSYSQGSTNGVMMALSTFHNGRIIGVGDSSPADDGTGNAGNNLYNGWSGEGDDRLFFLNGTYWLIANPNNGIKENENTVSNEMAIELLSNILRKNGKIILIINNPDKKPVNIDIYDITGTKVRNLYLGNANGKLFLNTGNLQRGVYFIKCSGFTKSLKLAIIN